ncbi:hypothetical protein BOTBODRAFT_40324 [Botryobasidium botryosum FD-172 SS1]|uniref:Uncharacterized protein n=1 Tax=Botryobasidium botryosum (strain FD-172 SS1) TaxID=930990 RepID=A0A067NBT9_BOTB1|nr:hypothetical protein BOTBODRAFT_40324 [Botryobasidium botryosum FD-172 SS1]
MSGSDLLVRCTCQRYCNGGRDIVERTWFRHRLFRAAPPSPPAPAPITLPSQPGDSKRKRLPSSPEKNAPAHHPRIADRADSRQDACEGNVGGERGEGMIGGEGGGDGEGAGGGEGEGAGAGDGEGAGGGEGEGAGAGDGEGAGGGEGEGAGAGDGEGVGGGDGEGVGVEMVKAREVEMAKAQEVI